MSFNLDDLHFINDFDNIKNVKLMESSDGNYILSLDDIINFCENNSMEFNDFINSLCESNNITLDELIISFNEDVANYDNDYLEDIYDISDLGFTVAAEAYGNNEVLDYLVEESLNGNSEPLEDTIQIMNEFFGNRFKSKMADRTAYSAGVLARYGVGKTIGGIKNGIAQGVARAADNAIGKKLFDSRERTGRKDENGNDIYKVYRNRKLTRFFSNNPDSAGSQFASDVVDGVRSQFSSDIKNMVRRLIGVTPDGQNTGGIITAINNKIRGLRDEERNLPPNQRYNLRNTLNQLMGLKSTITKGNY